MSGQDLVSLGALQLRRGILNGEWSAVQALEAHLERIARLDPELHAFQRVHLEAARARAAQLDANLQAGAVPGALFGVPVALKANLCLAGEETNCGSRMLQGFISTYSATCVERLLEADAVLLGMTEMDEFAMGSSGENSAYACARNPWDPQRSAGGSSSGSAVAVAAGFAPLSLGSDTGGSVRQPAAFCGVYGMKPTYGRVSRYGLIAFGSSLDQVSPFARTVADLERVLEVISGHDELDSTSLPLPPFEPERPAEVRRLTGLRVGVLAKSFSDSVDAAVRARCEEQLKLLEKLGAELVEVELPNLSQAIAIYYVVASAEASSNLGRYDGSLFGQRAPGAGSLQSMFAASREAGFGEEVKRRILLGTYVLSAGYHEAWYAQAQRARTLLRRDFESAFEAVDVIASPTTPSPAFGLGEKNDDALAMYLSDLFTVPASLTGLPALSLPAGLSEGDAGLPVGLQLTGPRLGEARLLRLAAALEGERAGALLAPPLAGASA